MGVVIDEVLTEVELPQGAGSTGEGSEREASSQREEEDEQRLRDQIRRLETRQLRLLAD